ncbi:hypothetical protein Q8F55_003576 [Vanrija albida]|uniref:Extracellular membrane protein CFEM domain-containing protein n=1 Tax=Vanrija albida TaxID=181172 RepID=A0ABR3Q4C8_9TREE
MRAVLLIAAIASTLSAASLLPRQGLPAGAAPAACVSQCDKFNLATGCNYTNPAGCTQFCKQSNFDILAGCLKCWYESQGVGGDLYTNTVNALAASCGALGTPVQAGGGAATGGAAGTGAGTSAGGAAAAGTSAAAGAGASASPSAQPKSGAGAVAVPVALVGAAWAVAAVL